MAKYNKRDKCPFFDDTHTQKLIKMERWWEKKVGKGGGKRTKVVDDEPEEVGLLYL